MRRFLWITAILVVAAVASPDAPPFLSPFGSRLLAQEAQRVQANVLRVEEGIVVLDKGSDNGVTERMVFDIYRPAQVVRLPLTDQTVYVREQVVAAATIVAVERTTSRGRLRVAGAAEVRPQDLAVSNPFAVPENQPPFVRSRTLTPESAALGQSIDLSLDIGNEANERWYIEWSATGGRLSFERSTGARVRWSAPPRAGTYQVIATIRDAAGGVTRESIPVRGTGLPRGGLPTVYGFAGARTGRDSPRRIADLDFDEQNRAYVLDPESRRLVVLDDAWGIAEATDPWDEVHSYDPFRIRLARGRVYVLDRDSRSVLRFSYDPKMFRQAPEVTYGGEGSGNGTVDEPVDFEVTERGEVCIVDGERGNIQVFSEDGRFLLSIGRNGTTAGELGRPVAIARGPGDRLFVLDDGRKRIIAFQGFRYEREFVAGAEADEFRDLRVDPFGGRLFVLEATTGTVRGFDERGSETGSRTGSAGPGVGQFTSPLHMRFDGTQRLYVLDGEGAVLDRADPYAGRVLGRLELPGPRGDRIAAARDGMLLVLDRATATVSVLGRDGFVRARFGGEGGGPASLDRPIDLAAIGDGEIAILDPGAGIKRFHMDGQPAGVIPVSVPSPVDLTAGPGRDVLGIVPGEESGRAVVMDITGRSILEPPSDFALPGPPQAGTIDSRGDLILLMGARAAVVVPGGAGHLTTLPCRWPTDADASPDGRIFVAASGKVFVLGAGLDGVAEIQDEAAASPYDVAVDDYGSLYIYDEARERVVEFAAR